VGPVLPLHLAANGTSRPALPPPPLVPVPHRQKFLPVSSASIPPLPALRMLSPSFSLDSGPVFSPILGTFAPRLNTMPSCLQVVPPPTPAYMGMQPAASMPRLTQMTASSTFQPYPSARPALPVSNFVQPPTLRLQMHPAASQSLEIVNSIFYPLVTANSVLPSPPLRQLLHNTSHHSSAPVIRATDPITFSSQRFVPLLSVANSVTVPRCATSNDFGCFRISGTGSTVVGTSVCHAVSTAPLQNLTYSSSSSSAVSRSRPPKPVTIEIIDDDDDDDSCLEQLAESDKVATTMALSTIESRPVPSTTEVVISSLPTISTASSTIDTERNPVQPITEVVALLPTVSTSFVSAVSFCVCPATEVVSASLTATASRSCPVRVDSGPVHAVTEVDCSLSTTNATSTGVHCESGPVHPALIEVGSSSPTADATSSTMREDLSPDQIFINVDSSSPSDSAASGTLDVESAYSLSPTHSTTSHFEDVESDPVEPEVIPSLSTVSSSNPVPGHMAELELCENSNHFQQRLAEVGCLRYIFQYLDICSRLNAAQVCHCWHRVALQQNLVNFDCISLGISISVIFYFIVILQKLFLLLNLHFLCLMYCCNFWNHFVISGSK